MNNNNKIFLLTSVTGVMALSILAVIASHVPSVSGQMAECQTSLSLSSYPNGGTAAPGSTLPVNLLGELKCDGSPIEGATIMISGYDDNGNEVQTNEHGKYSTGIHLASGVYTIQAFFAGDANHISASASKTITVK